MPTADTLSGANSAPNRSPGRDRGWADAALAAYLGAMPDILVSQPIFHDFPGAIDIEVATSVWTWLARDVGASPAARLGDAIMAGAEPQGAFEQLLPEFLEALKANDVAEKADFELTRRNTIQMGGQDARKSLPVIIMALRRRALLIQAARFGTAVGNLGDEGALATALQTITITNPVTRALWMQAMVEHMSNPSRMLAAVVSLSGGQSEGHVVAAGYGPLVEAVLSHAQGQIGKLVSQPSVFSDVDFACKAIDRFHRLMRALNYNLEIERRSRWGKIITDLTGRISERLERPVREINGNITQALRKPREGADFIDHDDVLQGFNGLYLLMTVRNSRDSLAVNALLDKAWSDTGQTLEVLMSRALDAYRADPGNAAARDRVDAGIKMAEIRFNAEYADILRRARDLASKRAVSS